MSVAEQIYYPGINYDEDRGPEIFAVAVAFIALSAVTLVLRAFSRYWTKVDVWLDDWLIIVAALLSWAYSIIVITEVKFNFYGQHITKADPYHLAEFGKQLYALAIIYPPALTFSKLSLLALYWRIFRVTTARRPLQILAALNIAWAIAAFLVGIFSCIPIKANWDQSIPKKCIDYPALFLSNEAITITFDLAVLLMPVYFISNIQRSLTQRISISITFLLGLVATLVSALRLWRLVLADRLPAMDATFTDSDAGMWATIELNVWILVASIPSLRPMALKLYQDKIRSSRGSSGKTAGGARTAGATPGGAKGSSSGRSGSTLSFWKTHASNSTRDKPRAASLSRAPFNRPDVGSSSATAMASPGSDARNWKTSSHDEAGTELADLGGIRVARDVEVSLEKGDGSSVR